LLHIKEPILWVGNLGAVQTLQKLKGKLVVYDCTDKFDKSRYIKAKELMKSLDEVMIEQADLIICVSKPLFRYYQSRASHKVHYLPHGVDFKHFASLAYKPQQPPLELRNIPHPIIGYYGTLTEANDVGLLQYCVKHKPEWSFVLVGNITEGDYRAVLSFPNVHALGYKPYEELPAYAACFDVCILFWKVYEWIHFCSPLKTKEYLALGKPVVSVRIPEIEEEFSDVISVASNQEEFLAALGDELRTDSPEKKRIRQAKVHNFTWVEYVAKVSDLLMEVGENETK
jgi:glycosyltransferase involved in cell wall biosynthesis